jgi:hypothetical protein
MRRWLIDEWVIQTQTGPLSRQRLWRIVRGWLWVLTIYLILRALSIMPSFAGLVLLHVGAVFLFILIWRVGIRPIRQ